MDTKQINLVEIKKEWIPALTQEKRSELAMGQMAVLQQLLGTVLGEVNTLIESSWVEMSAPDVSYNKELAALFPSFSEYPIGSCDVYYAYDALTFHSQFEGYDGRLITVEEFRIAFANLWDTLKRELHWDGGGCEWFSVDLGQSLPAVVWRDGDPDPLYHWNCSAHAQAAHIPIFRLPLDDVNSAGAIMLLWMKNGLTPIGLSKNAVEAYRYIMELYNSNEQYFSCVDSSFQYDEALLVADILSGMVTPPNGNIFESAQNLLREECPLRLPEELCADLKEDLLCTDKARCDIERYDEKLLTDPNRGHWDLWEELSAEAMTGIMKTPFVARDPRTDINSNGVIGIDFGTRSTVVVFQENNEHTLPMRIGTGNLSKKIEPWHYENPTVIEFNDIAHFLKTYREKNGRPETLWQDVTTSHAAYEGLLRSGNTDYYAYLHELKQWAGDKRRQVRIRDRKNLDVALVPFLDLGTDDLNPIELYAYFIGIYINNMHNGIYMDYLMSFPVSYEKAVRDKILDSFARGLKKSLPITIQNDEKVMQKFRVAAGADEPAAYAICALQEYGFEPEDDEKIFYGVFDFGGGTTDFDFGLWKEADPAERRYDYEMDCFGAGGDRYLGGENLLELMAFEVFKANQDILRDGGVTFILPPECNKFPGAEVLIGDSQEARLNTAQLMEKLRPLWERANDYEKLYESGKITVNLFDREGKVRNEFALEVSREELESILYTRIEKGIRNFFDSLNSAFTLPFVVGIDYVSIFLAGNASKSPIVREVFEKYITKATEEFANKGEEKFFAVFPPLGSKEAQDKQKEAGIVVSEEVVTRPTGKTGVAFGLVESRQGSRIKVVQQGNERENGEICFQYFIGFEKKKKFRSISNRSLPYGEWQEFIDAGAVDFTLYYTNLPEAGNNKLDIIQAGRKNCRIEAVHPEANIYYRALKPTVIEYAVATPEGLANGEFLEIPVELDLD